MPGLRAISNQQAGNATTASNVAGGLNTAAQGIGNTVTPALTQEATSPQGMGQTALTAMNTAGLQSTGGGQGAAQGQGNLEAARTRNAGAFQPAVDEAARGALRQNSTNALGTTLANEQLKQQQKQQGLAGLQGLYGTNLNAAVGNANSSNNALAGAAQSQEGAINSVMSPLMGVLGLGGKAFGDWQAAH